MHCKVVAMGAPLLEWALEGALDLFTVHEWVRCSGVAEALYGTHRP